MNKTKAQLKSQVELVRKGKDFIGECIVEVDLKRLNYLLEKEGLMDKDLGETIIELKDYLSIKIGNRKINIYLPITGSYSYLTGIINIYLHRDYAIYKLLGRSVELTSKGIVCTLAHEIDHDVRYGRIRDLSKNQIIRDLLLIWIGSISNLIYPVSPLEIMARWFARSKAKDPEWLKCVKITRTKN